MGKNIMNKIIEFAVYFLQYLYAFCFFLHAVHSIYYLRVVQYSKRDFIMFYYLCTQIVSPQNPIITKNIKKAFECNRSGACTLPLQVYGTDENSTIQRHSVHEVRYSKWLVSGSNLPDCWRKADNLQATYMQLKEPSRRELCSAPITKVGYTAAPR